MFNCNPDKTAKYLRSNFDELAILAVLTKLATKDTGDLSFEEETVVTAMRRSTPKLADADNASIGEYLHGYDQEQIPGIDIKTIKILIDNNRLNRPAL